MSRKPYQIALGEPEQTTLTGDVEPLGMVADDHAAAAATPLALDTVPPVVLDAVARSAVAAAKRAEADGWESMNALDVATEAAVRTLDRRGYAFTVEQVQDAVNEVQA